MDDTKGWSTQTPYTERLYTIIAQKISLLELGSIVSAIYSNCNRKVSHFGANDECYIVWLSIRFSCGVDEHRQRHTTISYTRMPIAYIIIMNEETFANIPQHTKCEQIKINIFAQFAQRNCFTAEIINSEFN